jgi:predicted XRE-type DNA-binding protein
MRIMSIEKIRSAAKRSEDARKKAAECQAALHSAVLAYLASKGFSQRQIAQALGFSLGYISDILNGKRGISEEFLRRIEGLK